MPVSPRNNDERRTNDITRIQDAASEQEAHVSHFGALKAATTIPVIKGNFPGTTLAEDIWTETIVTGASTTVDNGLATLSSGTNAAGSVKLNSVKDGRFEAGQVTVYQSGVKANNGQADNTRIWGLMTTDEQDGLYFSWKDESFCVVARKGGVETAVDSADFSVDPTFLPNTNNSTYRIEYSAGRAAFYAARRGRKRLLHEMVDTQSPLVDDLDLGMYYENTNTGNTSNVNLDVRGASISVWGDLRRFNESGSQVVTDESTEIALGNVEHRLNVSKFGRNPDIDTGSVPEDVWNGGGLYTGHPTSFTPETVEVFSSSTNDTSDGTGARTVRFTGLKSSTSTKYETEDVTLNGTSAVTPSTTWWRINRIKVLTAGSGGSNAGTITVRPSTTTSAVFASMAIGFNQTTILAYTIPAGNTGILKRVRIGMTRANGSAGSATASLKVRPQGGVYNASRVFEIAEGSNVAYREEGGLILNAGDDILVRVDDVSDSNTIVEGAIEVILRTP